MSITTTLVKATREPRKAVSVTCHRLFSMAGHSGFRRFVVLTRDRTGSNMLIQSLNSHPNISADYEIFAKLSGRTEKSILDKSFGKQPFYIKAKGFKIFYYHPQDASGSSIWDMLCSIEGLHVIHLKRRNILHALVSSKVAYTTGVYGVRSDKERAKYLRKISPVRFSAENLGVEFRQTENWEQAGDTRFRDHPILDVYYEDLVARFNQEFRRVTEFLGVEYRTPKTDFKKQRTSSMREIVANYDELKDEFSGTEWERFFED